jgi:anthranilate/para-aminobenzoate synthase component I
MALPRKPALLGFPDLLLAVHHYRKLSRPAPAYGQGIPAYHLRPLTTDGEHAQAVERCREFISAGYVYEANLTRPFGVDLYDEPSPGDFDMYLSQSDGKGIWSLSPECFLKRQGRELSTFPIKGTRPWENLSELLTSTKEAAEHLMVVDLERNDLGKLAEPGTVSVATMRQPRRYRDLYHLESEVTCRLRAGVDWYDILAATFPGGSITGTPKLAAMGVIHGLEAQARGPYTGIMGYLDGQGNGEFALLIRTLLTDGQAGRAVLNTGGGIVYDSEAWAEVRETHLKAQGLLRATNS